MQDKFLSHFTHELRTLISAIFTCTDLLGETLEDQPNAVEMVSVIRQNSGQVLKLINNALDLSKIESGKMTIEQIDCDPGQMVAEVVSSLRPAAAEKDLTIHVECRGSIPQTIRTDPMRLRQILLNLVDNAIKFTDRGGVLVSVEISQGNPGEGGWLCFCVTDTGIGLTHEHLERVFDPFVQAEISTARCHGGTGLGLAISKQLVCLLGGDLIIASEANEGSTVTLTIPTSPIEEMTMVQDLPQLMLGESSRYRPANPGRRHGPRLQGLSVLLIEDRPDAQLLVSVILKSAAAIVTLASSDEAVSTNRLTAEESNAGFDVVLLNMEMCRVDGCTVAKRLRDRGYRGPIVALTTRADGVNENRWREAGCTDWLSTSKNVGGLVPMVAQAAATNHMRQCVP